MSEIGARTTGGLVKIAITTGGTNYTSPPTVTISGGTGATLQAHLSGKRVESVVIVNPGSGFTGSPSVSFSGGGGTGAAATAYAYTGSLRPMSFFRGRYSDLYGVDGMGRGIRWNGTDNTVEKIGLNKPAVAPAVTASSTGAGKRVTAIQIVRPGAGYYENPTVSFSGGTPASTAVASARLLNGQVVGITVTNPGSGYQAVPSVSINGGIGTGASFGVGVLGRIDSIDVSAVGSGYTSNATTSPTVSFSTAQGLTGALATVNVNSLGRIDSVNILSAGTGATTTGVTATVSGGGGTNATLRVNMAYSVASITAVSSGSGYYAAPVVTIRAASSDTAGSGAAATASVNSAGNVTGVTVYSGGEYFAIPQALVLDTQALATATLTSTASGKYKCCIRYLDDTPESLNGPIPSSISELVEVDAGDATASFVWNFSHYGLDDRVAAMELWRTTSSQSVVLFRVATIKRTDANWATTYSDTFSDSELRDTSREGYALMPVTLPSGQINARRFEVPPGEFAVATMFQDRAWYAVDVTGERPNSLLYSEVDEPESVPPENELVVQENTGSPDKIVALIPVGSDLLVVQTAHIYKLSYVAQPVLDASISLVGYRGILNSRCWDVMGGVAFIADGSGVYAFDGQREESLSLPIDNYWRDSIIDFSKSDKFHVRCDSTNMSVRFFYCKSDDTETVRALCYCVATKAWWEEEYPVAVTASCSVVMSGKKIPLAALANGSFTKAGGTTDSGTGVPYQFRSGNVTLVDEGSRGIGFVYKPTDTDSPLRLSLHYNNSDSPRANAVASDRGDGFTTTLGSTAAELNMKKTRSALGDATGFAKAYYSGRVDDRSSGADRHLAIAFAGTQSGTTSGDAVTIHGVLIEGAK